jgi:hypothetical protein
MVSKAISTGDGPKHPFPEQKIFRMVATLGERYDRRRRFSSMRQSHGDSHFAAENAAGELGSLVIPTC